MRLNPPAPFIWSPRQPIDPMGQLAAPRGRGARKEKPNRWFLFRRVVNVSDVTSQAEVSITVDGRYVAFVNGKEIGRGPVRCSPLFQRYDTWPINAHLRVGANAICVLIHTYGVDTAFYEGVKGMWNPVFGEGGLWVEGRITTQSETQRLMSDCAWRCIESHAWEQATPRINHGLGFIESLDANLLPDNWLEPDFDDAAWDEAQILQAGGGGPEAFFGGLEVKPFPTLVPRGIPPMRYGLAGAKRVVWIKGQRSDASLPIERRLYEEDLLVGAEDAVSDRMELLKPEHANVTIKTTSDQDVSFLLDFGRIITGRPRVSMIAKGGEMIEIACSEHLPGEWDPAGLKADVRLTRKPLLGLDAHICRYTARPGEQVFERFEWCAIRWMQVVIRNAPDGLTLTGLGARTENYPVDRRGSFTCSDPFLNELWATGAYTLEMCMHDAWEDCPSREQRQWLGDATVENLVGWAAFGPSIVPLNAKFLCQAAESQRPDGLTQMFAPGDHYTDRLLIPDWTLQWILNAGDHYQHSGDLATIETIIPSIQKALAWFERLLADNGLLPNMPYWHFMDWAGVGRHGFAAALNAQLVGAWKAAATLCEACDMGRAAATYRARALKAQTALHELHWDERRGVYVDVLDPATGEQELRASQHANAALMLWGEMPDSRAASAIARITDGERLTFTAAPPIANSGETLDPESGVVLANTFYSHFVYEALAERGELGAAIELMRARFGPMLARGATTLWESFEPTASLCHAFSASPTWQLSRRVLGVYPLSPGYLSIGVAPNLANLEHASGVFPTPVGDVHVELTREADGFLARVQGPAGIALHMTTAAGLHHISGDLAANSDGFAQARYRSASQG
ncbi:alpha-L-rhamnosidase N-terminal domain-containing protein [Aquidulcibacter sp.]|uniref:alpha-L-rhamnosidase-related protein n=1 Tax=Aquidulcibacter sp. TaxID=2052990 RepID=UPI0037BF4109